MKVIINLFHKRVLSSDNKELNQESTNLLYDFSYLYHYI